MLAPHDGMSGMHAPHDGMSHMPALHLQAMAASWDSLCCNMTDKIFGCLSLLDLGRAAPTCRDFRAAYKACLSAAHLPAVEAGVSCFGEAFVNKLSRKIWSDAVLFQLLSPGKYRGIDVDWYISHDAPAGGYSDKPGWLSPRRGLTRARWCENGYKPSYFKEFPQMPPGCPSFGIHCVKEDHALRVTVSCFSSHCQETAGALAAVCE